MAQSDELFDELTDLRDLNLAMSNELSILHELAKAVGKYLDPGKSSGTCPDEYMNEDFLEDAYDKWRDLKEEKDGELLQ